MQPGSAGGFIWSLKNAIGNDVWSFEASLRNGWLAKSAGECALGSTDSFGRLPVHSFDS